MDSMQAAVDSVVRLLPDAIGKWSRGGDLAGTVHWSHPNDRIPMVYATPNWEGENLTPVAAYDGFDEIENAATTLPFDATTYVGREQEGAAEYVLLLTPVLRRVEAQYGTGA